MSVFDVAENIGIIFFWMSMIMCILGTFKFIIEFWNRHEDKRYFIYSFALSLILGISTFGCLVASKHYSVDSMNTYFDMAPWWQMAIGRYTNWCVVLFALKLGINTVIFQQLFVAIWIIIISITNLMIVEGITRYMSNMSLKKYIAILIGVCLIYDNVFVMELALFTEAAMWSILGSWALGLSIWMVLRSDRKASKWLLGTYYLLVALGSYQGFVGIFEVFVLLGLFLKYYNDGPKRYKSAGVALLIGGFASIFNIVLVKILLQYGIIGDSGRSATFDFKIILHNLEELGKYQLRFWKDADGFFHPAVMAVLLLIILLICINLFRFHKKAEQIIYLLLMLIGTYVLAFAPHIVESRICITPRSNLAVWSVIAVALIMGICWAGNKIEFYTLFVVLAILMINQTSVANDMAANERATNAADFTEARIVAEKIYEYEAETGNYVTKIAMKGDNELTWYSPVTKYYNGELGARIMATFYSNYRLMGYVMGRNIEKVEMPDSIYESFFANKNWDYLNAEEQIYCEGDTAYIIVY